MLPLRALKLFSFFCFVESGVGIDEKSLILNLADLRERCANIAKEFGGALVEKYIEGREFTVLVCGNKHDMHVFPPVEYIFPADKSFITFDDKWGRNYSGTHWCLLSEQSGKKDQPLIDSLMLLARQLYESFNGDGYARIDIRQDDKTQELFILDCNPNCSLFYRDSCSADAILELSGWSKTKFMRFLIDQALERQRIYHMTHSYTIKYFPSTGFAMYAARNLSEGDLIYTQENTSFKLITKQHAERTFNEREITWFNNFGTYPMFFIFCNTTMKSSCLTIVFQRGRCVIMFLSSGMKIVINGNQSIIPVIRMYG